MSADAIYLGDGLYVTHDRWQVELYAHNGIEKTNSVFLDPPTLRAFLGYLEREGLRDELRDENAELRCRVKELEADLAKPKRRPISFGEIER